MYSHQAKRSRAQALSANQTRNQRSVKYKYKVVNETVDPNTWKADTEQMLCATNRIHEPNKLMQRQQHDDKHHGFANPPVQVLSPLMYSQNTAFLTFQQQLNTTQLEDPTGFEDIVPAEKQHVAERSEPRIERIDEGKGGDISSGARERIARWCLR